MPIWESVREDWEFVLNINVTGLVLCCKAVLPGMIERKYGRIVNIASIAGQGGQPEDGPLLREQGGGDRADQVAVEGTGRQGRHLREQRLARP